MSSPSSICIVIVSFSESSPLSHLCHFLPPFSFTWPLTSQGPPAYTASAGLLSNQILTVKVCPSQDHPSSLVHVHKHLCLYTLLYFTSTLFPQPYTLREDGAGWIAVSPVVIAGIPAFFLFHSVHLSHYLSSAVRWSSLTMSMAFSRLQRTTTLFTGIF